MRIRSPLALLVSLAAMLPLSLRADESDATGPAATGQAAATPPPCSSPAHRAFDFWIGEWEVFSGDTRLGRNSIRRIEDGCGISEHWRGDEGGRGVSYNAWDAADGRWHQFWISAQGYVLRLHGGPTGGGAMVMEGEMPAREGGTQRQRITWTPNADGTVRQLWESLDPASGNWTVAFDGTYRRSTEQPPAAE